MADEIKGTTITQEDIDRYKKMQAMVAEYRKTLAPKKEAIVASIQKLPMKDIVEILAFEGKTGMNYDFEWEEKPYTMRISLRKTAG